MALTKLNTHGIGADVILAEDIAANAVTVSEIQDDAVTQAKVADQAIDEARMQISNAGTNGQFLQKQSGNTGGLTWADATLWTVTTEGEVTTSAAQDNIDFTIPADANRIKVMFWGLSQVPTDEFQIKLGTTDGTILGSGDYMNTSWYHGHGATLSLAENNDAIQLNGWTYSGNYWYGCLNLECIDNDRRRWYWNWNPYNSAYGEYHIAGNGKTDVPSGQQVRKVRFTCATNGGYDASGRIKVVTAEV
tara:strand:+ start:42 stop:785 length:744 start_codon:yes stop_codon:yes gene_type:complete